MARPLQVLSLLSRLGALSVLPPVSTNGCRFASRGASKAWVGQSHGHRVSNSASRYSDEMSDEELGLDDVEDKLQALDDEGRKRQKTVKYHILRRRMTPSGAPQRKLTWDAIEQIRYLKQEQPDEWTVDRLAEGFSVTPDVIQRVLRSKFVPTPERRAKQNSKVVSGLSQQVLPLGAGTGQDRLKLIGNHTPAVLPSGRREGAVVPVAEQPLILGVESSGLMANSPAPVTVLPTQFRAGISKDAPVTRGTEENRNTNPTEEDEEDDESWDGLVLTEEDLQEFMEMEKPSPVAQVGNDFFDAEGNFLYRI
ncbi:neugrin [Micropterus salmoides]|uniref:neugrin n=1 Tax=Micropterus salmoides TaxID=27706 RepID=UPI0018ED99F7|nr:neugrin [Micropterus salmoides]